MGTLSRAAAFRPLRPLVAGAAALQAGTLPSHAHAPWRGGGGWSPAPTGAAESARTHHARRGDRRFSRRARRTYNAGSFSVSIEGSGSWWIMASKPRKRL